MFYNALQDSKILKKFCKTKGLYPYIISFVKSYLTDNLKPKNTNLFNQLYKKKVNTKLNYLTQSYEQNNDIDYFSLKDFVLKFDNTVVYSNHKQYKRYCP